MSNQAPQDQVPQDPGPSDQVPPQWQRPQPPQWGQQQPPQWQNPQQPGYGWPAAPPLPPLPPQRRFGRRQISAIVSLVILAAVAGGGYAYNHFKSTDNGVTAVTCTPFALTSCLVARPPSAQGGLADSWNPTATPTKADYLKWAFDADPIAQKIAGDNLTSQGLQNIAHAAWKAADGNGIDIVLLKFSSEQGAHARSLELIGTDMTSGDSGNAVPVPIPVPAGVPGSAYSSAKPNSNGDIDTRYAAYVGDIALQVSYYSPGSYSSADFSNWLGAEYKSLTSAPKVAPSPQPTSVTQSVTCSGGLPSCLIAAPSDSSPWSDAWGSNTSPSVAQYTSQMFGDSSWRTIINARLKAVGATGVAHRAFITSNGAEADDLLISFSTANGALSWYKNDAYSATGTAFTIPGQQNASGTYDTKADADGNIPAQVFGVNGTVAMELFTWSPKSFDQTRTVTWASQQLGEIGKTSKTQTAVVPPVPMPTGVGSGASGSSSSCSSPESCLMAAPSGSVPWSGSDYDKTTTATVQQYVHENWSSEGAAEVAYEEKLLNDAGVTAIAHREWDAADGSSTMVTILQYGSPKQAQSEALDYQGAILATGSEVIVPGLNDAVVDIKPLDASGDVPVKIDFWKGSYEVRLAFYSPATANPQAAVSVALQQLAELPGS